MTCLCGNPSKVLEGWCFCCLRRKGGHLTVTKWNEWMIESESPMDEDYGRSKEYGSSKK